MCCPPDAVAFIYDENVLGALGLLKEGSQRAVIRQTQSFNELLFFFFAKDTKVIHEVDALLGISLVLARSCFAFPYDEPENFVSFAPAIASEFP
jgi:hypothetical protein